MNDHSFAQFYKKHFPYFLPFVIEFVENEEDANDVVQEVFMACWESVLFALNLTVLLSTQRHRNVCLSIRHSMVRINHERQLLGFLFKNLHLAPFRFI